MGIRLSYITDLPANLAAAGNKLLTSVSGGLTRLTAWSDFADWIIQTYPGFMQSGIGATSQTMQGKGRKIVHASDYDSLSEAVTAAASKTLIIENTQSVSSDLTIGDTVNLVIERGGKITPASGVTVTINGTLTAGTHNALDTSSNGLFAGTFRVNRTEQQPYTIVLFGTSIENLQYDSTLNGPEARGYLTFFNIMAGWPFKILTNAGTGSDTSLLMLGRVGADVIAQKPGWCIVGAPINDPGNSIAYATTIARMKAIWNSLRAAGVKVIVQTMAPTNTWNAATVLGATIREHQSRYNDAAREYAATTDGVYLHDHCRAMTNPATGIPIASPTVVVSDGIHMNYQGGMLSGRALYHAIGHLMPKQDKGLSTPFDYLNYAFNGVAEGDNASGTNGYANGTGVTGQGPNAWLTGRRATGTGVASKVARSAAWQPETLARMEVTCVADRDGAGFFVGGSDIAGTGRYDQTWAANTAYALGIKRKPTVANGFHYFVYTAGTTGGSEPTWPTQAGQFVTDNTVTWVAYKSPVAGDEFYAECEIATSSLSGDGVVVLRLDYIDTAGATVTSTICNSFDLGGTVGAPATFLPETGFLRTDTLTIPSQSTNPIRYLRATIFGYGSASSTFNLDVTRVAIRKYVS